MRFIVRGRIGLVLMLLLVITGVVGGSGWWLMSDLSSDITRLYHGHLKASVHLSSAERNLWELRFALPNYVLEDVSSRGEIDARGETLVRGVEEHMRAYAALPISSKERDLLAEWEHHFDSYLRARPRYFELVRQGKLDEAREHRSRATNPPARESVRVLSVLIETQKERADALAEHAQASALLGSRSMIGLVVIALALGLFLSRSLTGYVAERVATALGGVQRAASELEVTAGQQVSSASELSSATTEISATVRELLTTSRQISDSAREVAKIAEETGGAARSGDALVKQAQEALATMRRKVDETVGHMLTLGARSQQIGSILELINELADQTNILSINARIEAAGASESGRRFAVVADEIRRLADRVASSSREIRGLVDEIRAAANTTVMATEDGAKAVDAGARQFQDVLRMFGEIAARVGDTSLAARQIEHSTSQQVSAVEHVSVAMSDIVRSAKETEQSSQSTQKTCEQLVGISRQLAALTGGRPAEAPAGGA